MDPEELLDICLDLTFFKQRIKELRRFDDNVIPEINARTTRAGNRAEECQKIKSQMSENYRQRDELLASCISKISAYISSDVPVDLERRSASETLAKIQADSKVEGIVREQAQSVYHYFSDNLHFAYSGLSKKVSLNTKYTFLYSNLNWISYEIHSSLPRLLGAAYSTGCPSCLGFKGPRTPPFPSPIPRPTTKRGPAAELADSTRRRKES